MNQILYENQYFKDFYIWNNQIFTVMSLRIQGFREGSYSQKKFWIGFEI
jgi:hypothetical protein